MERSLPGTPAERDHHLLRASYCAEMEDEFRMAARALQREGGH